MKTKLPIITATIVFVAMCIGLVAGLPIGTLSGFGWSTISILCPIGAITTMIASHTIIPRGVISIVLMIVAFLVLGRFFCGWMCPVPLWGKVKNFFKSSKKRKAAKVQRAKDATEIASYDLGLSDACKACGGCSKGKKGAAADSVPVKPEKPAKFDSRHIVLIGAILSTLIFGFPVFCVVCPVGLSFAVILLIFRMFAYGDVTISIIIALVIIIVEVFVLKKWCTHICPMSGFMTLFTRFNKVALPTIDNTKCIETTTGKPCSRCASVCDAGINLRHPDFGERGLRDCVRCRSCVNACPTSAISMPILPKKGDGVAYFRSDGKIAWPEKNLANEPAAGKSKDAVSADAATAEDGPQDRHPEQRESEAVGASPKDSSQNDAEGVTNIDASASSEDA